MPDLVLLDTMICIWAFKGEASPGQKEKIREAREFIEYLDTEGYEVGISAVTLSELMVAVPDGRRQEFSRSLQDAVCVFAFDVGASIEAARLFKKWLDERAEGSEGRQIVKADCQIAGTALSRKAAILYTEDAQLLKIVDREIEARPMPAIPQQELDL